MLNIKTKAASIRLLILDIDGVLTTGTIYYGSQGMEMRGFHVLDGLGIRLLQKFGIQVAVISGKTAEGTRRRLEELEIKHCYLGMHEKLSAYLELKQQLNLADQQIAYIGDDLPDLPLLKRVGLAVTVPHAPAIVMQHAHVTTKNQGGLGAVREICDLILEAQDHYQTMLDSFAVDVDASKA